MDYEQLEQADEDALHTSRLLPVEEKPFKRITKRLLNAETLISTPPASLPTPPPDADPTSESQDNTPLSTREDALRKQLADRAAWRTDLLLDFAALESSVARIQLLRSSNADERSRYAAERERILAEATSIRESTVELRVRLGQARQDLEQRKAYDVLAERITTNRMLRPREDQAAALAKLETEIEALEGESSGVKATWAERRVQFGRIVEEGKQMLRLIRDEKEEAERKEGMEGDDDGDGDEVASGREGGASVAGTPKPDFGGATPSHGGGLEVENVSGTRLVHGKDRLAPGPRSVSSRAPTPTPHTAKNTSAGREEAADTEMVDSKQDDDDEADEGEVASSSGSAEEGEHIDEELVPESMDLT